jgi:hypothetical protein
MRPGQLLFALGITSAFLVPLGAGCGGASSSPDSDSGTEDVTTADSPPETATTEGGLDASDGSADARAEADALPLICQIDADIGHLNVPDASIGDSGVSIGTCISCIQTACGTEVSACETDCACKVNVQGFVTCLGSGQTTTMCGASVYGSGDPATGNLFTCLLFSSCFQTCGAGP